MCAQVAITPFIDPIIMLAEIIQIGCGFRANRIMHFVKTYLVSNPQTGMIDLLLLDQEPKHNHS
jgi:hypothetical protein